MTLEPLSREKMKGLPFKTVAHLNGGSEWTAMSKVNEEYGIVYSYRTDGRPEYRYTERCLATQDGEIVADLMSEDVDGELDRFFSEYNAKYVPTN